MRLTAETYEILGASPETWKALIDERDTLLNNLEELLEETEALAELAEVRIKSVPEIKKARTVIAKVKGEEQ